MLHFDFKRSSPDERPASILSRKILVATGAALLLGGVAEQAAAGAYLYHPMSVLRLGGSLNVYRPDLALPQCLEYDKVYAIDSPVGAPRTTFESHLIRTRKELYGDTQDRHHFVGQFFGRDGLRQLSL